MGASDKITILLADEDALRRDGLAAVLRGNAGFEIIAQCPDGEIALNQIRQGRPDVAVVDLNLPKLHGIELVRRVRSEALGTKIVVLSGSTDDDIIREVVRAGGDAYLLKNGPARHLIDAISYVRDGGQYFSPQLRRDGLDRHLLEEKPRPADDRPPRARGRNSEDEETDPPGSDDEYDDQRPAAPRSDRGGRSAGRPRAAGRQASDRPLRDRLRDESRSENLAERDYEILDLMAEGIRPILDRLDEIENRVGEMETGEAPVPGDVRNWLSTQIADTFQDSRASGREVAVSRTINDLEARLPQMIEDAVTSRFHNMASKLQQEIEETHVRTLETFVKNIQVKLVQRVSALETDMSKQAEAMNQLREYSQRTEDNLSRLISGVDKLAQELPKRLGAPDGAATASAGAPTQPRKKSSRSFSPKILWMAVAAILVIVVAAWQVPKLFKGKETAAAGGAAAYHPAAASADSAASGKLVAPPVGADTRTKLEAAGQYTERKDYSMAEDIYKQVLKAEPNNVDAMKALASVLYREDKIEESAAILDKLPKTN
jgi:DNA-binding NarL/FixJ family response regulator